MHKLALIATAALFLTGCVTDGATQPVDPSRVYQEQGSFRGDVNPDYRSGSLEGLTEEKTPTLDELINTRQGRKEARDPEDRLRYPALREGALSYGARGGLAHTSRQINRMLERRSSEFNQTYDFSKAMVPGPDGTMVLPPVIVEARDAYEMGDAGRTVRLADTVYEIIEQARFTPVAPLWHGYLIREYSAPTPPPDTLLPRNDGERDLWRRWVTEGWMKGVEQAHQIFQADLDRLERDFTGMIRYKQLKAEGKVSEPMVADAFMGVTGTGQDMRVNDRHLRITQDPVLQVDPSQWSSSVSNMTPSEAATPPGGEQAEPSKPRPTLRRF